MDAAHQKTSLRDRALAIAELFVLPRSPLDYLRGSALASGGHRVRVVATKSECPGTTTLTLSPAPASFTSGQHVDVGILVDGAFQTRTFSISSAPGARTFDVTVRAAAHGRVTPLLVDDTRAGDELRVSAPKGDFVLSHEGPLLFVTAGSGITPIMSILRSLRGPRDITHLHFERTRERVLFDAELTALSEAHPTYQRTTILTGDNVNVDTMITRISQAIGDSKHPTYACGPGPLLDAMRALYKDRPDDLVTESFGATYTPAATDEEPSGQVSFSRSDVRVDVDGRTSLLVMAERAGLKPTHGCRRGLCHSCEAPLVKGTVRDIRTGMTTTGNGACVQLCISAAVTDVEVAL